MMDISSRMTRNRLTTNTTMGLNLLPIHHLGTFQEGANPWEEEFAHGSFPLGRQVGVTDVDLNKETIDPRTIEGRLDRLSRENEEEKQDRSETNAKKNCKRRAKKVKER